MTCVLSLPARVDGSGRLEKPNSNQTQLPVSINCGSCFGERSRDLGNYEMLLTFGNSHFSSSDYSRLMGHSICLYL